MLIFFSFDCELMIKNYKNSCFYGNAHLRICSICLRLDSYSLTEIQYWHIEPGEKGTHKCFICTDLSDEQRAIDAL